MNIFLLLLAGTAFAGTPGALSQLADAAGVQDFAWPKKEAPSQPGNVCDRSLPRESAVVPEFKAPEWTLVDQGNLEFQYRFYARAGETKVAAMVVEAEFGPGAVETRITWQTGGEVNVFTRGPLAEQRKDPLCIRAVRPDLDLERLYQTLKPRLRRST